MRQVTLLIVAALMAFTMPPRLAPPRSAKPIKPIDAASSEAAQPPADFPRHLLIPVDGVKAGELSDTYRDSRGNGRVHDAIDIMAPRGTPVVAVDDGRIAKLFLSKPGGQTIYEFDRDEKYAYYYAHLDRYADGLAEGREVKRGEVIGYVGSTGNASPQAPHLHFAIFVLDSAKRWWEGTAINPYPVLSSR